MPCGSFELVHDGRSKLRDRPASANVYLEGGFYMRSDDDTDLAEQVEHALRALGIASTRARDECPDGISRAVSELRKGASAQRIKVESDLLRQGED